MTLVKNFQSLVEIFHVREKLASIPPLARVLSSLILAALRKDSKLKSHLIPQTGKKEEKEYLYLFKGRAVGKHFVFFKDKCVLLYLFQ